MPTLDWLNRDAAFRIAAEVPYRMLELVSEHRSEKIGQLSDGSPDSIGQEIDKRSIAKSNKNDTQAQLNWANEESANEEGQPSSVPASAPAPTPTHDNLLIQGDNLEALKALLPFYRGQVKCISIDPPYKTNLARVRLYAREKLVTYSHSHSLPHFALCGGLCAQLQRHRATSYSG